MTTKDKTRDKLVGSLRKTKAAADIGTDSAETETPTTAPVAETTVKTGAETVVKTKAAQLAAETDRRGVSTSRPARGRADGYQSGRRVWPD